MRGAHAFLRGHRIVALRVERLACADQMRAFQEQVINAIRLAEGAVLCGDYRLASPVPPPVARLWSRAMRATNATIIRCALLVDPTNVLFNLQLHRMVQCAHNPMRRIFTDTDDLAAWLAAECSEADRHILKDIVADPDS